MPKANPRRDAPLQEADFFPTPPEVVRSIVPELPTNAKTFWEPAAGRGHIARTLTQEMERRNGVAPLVVATDLNKLQSPLVHITDRNDFLFHQDPPFPEGMTEFGMIITNPPFKLWTDFAKQAVWFIKRRQVRHAMLFGRLQMLEGSGRHTELWGDDPPDTIYIYSRRIRMAPGYSTPQTSTIAFAWYYWTLHFPLCVRKAPRVQWLSDDLTKHRRPEDDDFKVKCEGCARLYEPLHPDCGTCVECRRKLPTTDPRHHRPQRQD